MFPDHQPFFQSQTGECGGVSLAIQPQRNLAPDRLLDVKILGASAAFKEKRTWLTASSFAALARRSQSA